VGRLAAKPSDPLAQSPSLDVLFSAGWPVSEVWRRARL